MASMADVVKSTIVGLKVWQKVWQGVWKKYGRV